jgi:hypothetical protein
MLAFMKRFLLHYGSIVVTPWDGFPPCAMRGAPLSPDRRSAVAIGGSEVDRVKLIGATPSTGPIFPGR